jgi:hypothetical protein
MQRSFHPSNTGFYRGGRNGMRDGNAPQLIEDCSNDIVFVQSSGLTTEAIARAAANLISSLTDLARTASSP